MATSTKTKSYIIDSSVVISYLMFDEQTNPAHLDVINLHTHHHNILFAPYLLLFEVGNSLRSGVLSKRITKKQALTLFSKLSDLDISLSLPPHNSTLTLAIENNLSYYDASYLALAKQLKAPLLTLDKKLLALTKIWQFVVPCYITLHYDQNHNFYHFAPYPPYIRGGDAFGIKNSTISQIPIPRHQAGFFVSTNKEIYDK